MKDSKKRRSPTYIDTPRGLLTEMGTLFSTTEDSLKKYAGELIDHEPVEKLLACADSWLRFPSNFSLWLTPVLLWYFHPALAVGVVLLSYVALSVIGPLYVNHTLSFVPNVLNQVALQFVLYLIFLSIFLQAGDYMAAIVGFVFFVLLRWGIIKKSFSPILMWVRKKLYTVPYEDKVLKSLIVRKSMKYRTELLEVHEIEMSIMRKISGH